MLRYEPFQLSLGGTEYLLLPKLIRPQVLALADRLSDLGFKLVRGPLLNGSRAGQTIRVDPAGLCWSNRDPIDAIAPVIPDLLRIEKQPAGAVDVASMYLRSRRLPRAQSYRFLTRVESGPLWTGLRKADQCGISPDESRVIRLILSSGIGRCDLLTDFPVVGSRVRVFGSRQYYTSSLACTVAASSLRFAGARQERNSYLPKGGEVVFRSLKRPNHNELVSVLKDLGEWCYFDPY